MSRERELFERAITEAYTRQVSGQPTSTHQARARMVTRGRRRRMARGLGSLALVAIIATGAVASVDTLRDGKDRFGVVDAPVIGAEKIMELGGPLAASSNALFVANGKLSNDAGNKASIARFDLATGEVTDTDPSSVASPLNIAVGQRGLWLVQWTGDMPVGGEGHPVNGRIQLVDPVSGEVLLDLPREDSAPYDVAVGEMGGREIAWVVDVGRQELLAVDAASGDLETVQLKAPPSSVTVGAGAVWVSSNSGGGKAGALTRYDLVDGSLQTFPVEHCMNDLVVMDASVWAADYCLGQVHQFDAATGEELATVAVAGNPTAITAADGLVWVATGNDIVRIDPTRAEVIGEPIAVGEGPQYLAAAGDTVFVSSFDGVYRLGEGLPVQEPVPTPTPEESRADPRSSETCNLDNVMCIPLDREWSIAGAGFGSAWVGNVGEGKTFGIARFDAETGDEIARLRTDGFVQGFAPDERWMWALLDTGGQLTLLKIDPETTSVSASYDLGGAGDVGDPSVVAGGGYVWVSGPGGSVTRVSAVGGEIVTMSYGDELAGYGADNGPVYLAYGENRLWLSYGAGHLGVVDPASGELVRLDKDVLGVNAYNVIVAAGQVWSPHQSPYGDNQINYTSTSGPGSEHGRVLLLDAVPGLAATDGEHIWVVQQSFNEKEPGWLVEVDSATHSVIGEPLEVDLGFQGGLAVGDGFVWVTGNKVLYRITAN